MRDNGLGSWAARRARTSADKPALVEQDRAVTYRELADLADSAASDLEQRGVARGDRVAYLGLNSIDLVVAMLGTAKLGAVFVPLNTRLAPPELAYMLHDADPALLIHTDMFAETVAAAPISGLQIPTVTGALRSGIVASDSVDAPVGLEDLFMIQYTSGTSGRPKGVCLTHGNVTWNVVNLLGDVDIRTDEVALVTAPLFHTAALNQVLFPTLFKGGTALIEPRFDAERSVRSIEEHGVTLLFGVTSMYLALAATPDFAAADLSTLRSALTGGAPVPDSVLRTWAERGVPLIQGYGMTESSPGATMLRAEDAQAGLGTAGAAVFFADVRVVDDDAATISGPGEVQMTGPNVSSGYWRNENATADSRTEDGWLRSGDLATVDAAGRLRIVGRLKDMFVSGGENVYPAEVEAALHEHPAVAECAVIGVPDARWGEVGHAVVALHPASSPDASALLEHLDGRLARYKIPKTIAFVDELPRNGAGKVLKSALRKEHLQ